ncbi:MAG: hypothetical protein ABIS17_13335 [Casimicrobiaceae bacterium]
MNARDLHARLSRAELDYALFNALRTARDAGRGGIQRGTAGMFEYLLDPQRHTSLYYNRAVCHDPGPLSADTLAALPDAIAAVELAPVQATEGLAEALWSRGFRPAYQLCYLGRVPGVDGAASVAVERLDPADVDAFFDLLKVEGIDFPPEKRARKRTYYGTAQFQIFVARTAEGVPCGWTTMFVGDGNAFFGNSFTVPEHRHAGIHAALLAARLEAAAAARIDVAYTDVEHRSQSHYNCERSGFRVLTINTIWGRNPARGTIRG